jgi:hypothetical protein
VAESKRLQGPGAVHVSQRAWPARPQPAAVVVLVKPRDAPVAMRFDKSALGPVALSARPWLRLSPYHIHQRVQLYSVGLVVKKRRG